MSLVLNGKYVATGYWIFISNRLLRLYPAYVVVMFATIALIPARWPPVNSFGSLYFAISQATIFGQDAEMFLTIRNSALAFTSNFNLTSQNLFEYAPIPQAWTLGVELWFYLFAPFVLKKSIRTIVVVLLCSLALRVILQFAFGFAGDPWSYRFFPSEMALFMLGAVAHRASLKTLGSLAVAVAAVLLLNRPNGVGRIASVAFLAVTATSIPWLFARTKEIKFDRFLGELSYPVYLVHILVLLAIPNNPALAMMVAIGSSIAIFLFVDRPIDEWRQRRLKATDVILIRVA